MELNYIPPQRKLTPDTNISEWDNLATAGVSSEPFSNLQLAKLKGSLQVFGGFSINIGGLNGGNISYHQISKYPKTWHKKPKKSSNKNGGGFRFPPLLPPGNRLVVDLLLAAGTKASLRAAHAAEQGTAPKQAAELAKVPKMPRKGL